jgi:hypothetical protein
LEDLSETSSAVASVTLDAMRFQPGGVSLDADPMNIRFTRDSIYTTFASGTVIDDTIDDALLIGARAVSAFPPMEVVEKEGCWYSMSNKRLFVFRVLATHGVLPLVQIVLYQASAPRIPGVRYEERHDNTWECTFTTQCGGVCVRVESRHWEEHRSSVLEAAAEAQHPNFSVSEYRPGNAQAQVECQTSSSSSASPYFQSMPAPEQVPEDDIAPSLMAASSGAPADVLEDMHHFLPAERCWFPGTEEAAQSYLPLSPEEYQASTMVRHGQCPYVDLLLGLSS